MSDLALREALAREIKRSGLSASRWGRQVAGVTDRTVRHWLKGSRDIPRRIEAVLNTPTISATSLATLRRSIAEHARGETTIIGGAS